MGKRVKKVKKINPKRKRLYIISTILIALVLLGGFVFYKGFDFFNSIKSDPSQALRKPKDNENVNILIVGIDAGKFADWDRKNDIGRTDTVIVASYNKKANKINLLSIPRDTRVQIKGKYDKINAAYPLGGIDQSIKSTSDLLGIPIHHYVQVNYESFMDMVDILGGVTVYVDPGIKNSINIPTNLFTPGVQTLKGKKAFYFVQARNSDLDRVNRQQVFLKALFNEVKEPENVVKIPQIMDAVKNDIKTDMKASELMSLSNNIKNVPSENIQTETVPGLGQYIGGISYYIADEAKLDELIAKLNINK